MSGEVTFVAGGGSTQRDYLDYCKPRGAKAMNDDIMEVDQNLLNLGQMEASLLRCVCLLDNALGRPFRTPEDFDEQEFGGYRAAMLKVIEFVEANEEKTFDLNELAALAWKTFMAEVHQPPGKFEDIHAGLREKWRFFVKHLFNLMAYDGSEDGSVQKHEEEVTARFQSTLEQQGLITKG